MGGMHDFKPFLGDKIMHTTEEIAKNHAYHRKRYRGLMKIMHTAAFDAAGLQFSFAGTFFCLFIICFSRPNGWLSTCRSTKIPVIWSWLFLYSAQSRISDTIHEHSS